MTDLRGDMTRGTTAAHDPAHAKEQRVKLFDGFARPEPDASQSTAANTPSADPATLKLRVAEARVEDVGLAIARMASADLLRYRS